MNAEAETPEAAPKKIYRRKVRNIIIHRPMQREFTLVIVAMMMISMLAIGFIIHDTIREAAFGGGFRFGKINPYEVLSEVSYQLILKVSCVLFGTLLVIGFFSIFFLHRIAGPVYRFRMTLRKLRSGQPTPPIRLREGDFFTELADELNATMDHFQGGHQNNKIIREKLEQLSSSSSDEKVKSSIEEIKKLVE